MQVPLSVQKAVLASLVVRALPWAALLELKAALALPAVPERLVLTVPSAQETALASPAVQVPSRVVLSVLVAALALPAVPERLVLLAPSVQVSALASLAQVQKVLAAL